LYGFLDPGGVAAAISAHGEEHGFKWLEQLTSHKSRQPLVYRCRGGMARVFVGVRIEAVASLSHMLKESPVDLEPLTTELPIKGEA
jgi:hypothetical protein